MKTSVTYKAEITIYVVENGLLIKDSTPQSLISKMWVARDKKELTDVVDEIYDAYKKGLEK